MSRRAAVLTSQSPRDLAVNALAAWAREGRDVRESLEHGLRANVWSACDRAFATELAYGVCRRLISLDHLVAHYSSRPLVRVDPVLHNILRVGLYQMLFVSRTPDFAAVNEAVQQAKRTGLRGADGFVNAVLRAAQGDMAGHVEGPVTLRRDVLWLDEQDGVAFGGPVFADPVRQQVKHYQMAFGYPAWLVKRWQRQFDAATLLKVFLAGNSRPLVSLRVNPLRCVREQLVERLRQAGVGTELWGTNVTLTEGAGVESLPGYAEGWFSVQDVTATEAAALLEARPGERVLDLCAAPGGKTMCLAGAMENTGVIVASDVSGERLALIEGNCRRLGVTMVQMSLADEVGELVEREGLFDAALVDVPCSNTGVLARRVEVRHRLKPVHLQTLRARQAELLERAAGWLKSGGRLVYSTCSVESAENEQMVGGFLERHSDFERVRHCHWLPGRRGARGKAPVLPGDGFEGEGATGAGSPLWRDGGYACLLERRAGAETVGGAAHACARGN